MSSPPTPTGSPLQLLVAECDRDERYITVGQSYAARFGLTPAQVLGRTVKDLLGPRVHEELIPYIADVLAGHEVTFEREVPYEALGFRHMRCNYVPRFDERGRVVAFIVALSDISATVEIERLRQGSIDRAAAAQEVAETTNRMKDEFLAIISHELRTPITAMLGWARLLQTRPFDAEATQRAVAVIERNAKTTAVLVEDLLDVSRIVTGAFRIGRETIDVGRVVLRAVDAIMPSVEAKGLQLGVSVDPSLPPMRGDAIRLQQVLGNLLTNAVRYTPAGRIDVTLRARTQHVEIQIRDTGQGIQSEFLPFMFDRFRQGDASTTRRYGGLGLGLAIARHLVELHGGTIRADSPGPNQGATFTVSLPFAVGESEAPGAIRRSEQSQAVLDLVRVDIAGVQVVVADADVEARELVAAVLRQHGAVPATAGMAAEVRQLLTTGRPDVLLSAITLLDEDGYSLIRSLRANADANWADIPAAALTSHVRVEDRTRALAAGFQTHIRKPVDAAELVAAVAGLASLRRPRG